MRAMSNTTTRAVSTTRNREFRENLENKQHKINTGCLLIFQPWFQGFQGRVLGFLGPFQGFQVRFLAKFRVLSPSRYKHFRPGANLGAHLTTFLAGLFTISDKKVRLKSLSLMYANFLRVLLNNICSWIIKNRADTIWDETNRTKLLFQMCQLS